MNGTHSNMAEAPPGIPNETLVRNVFHLFRNALKLHGCPSSNNFNTALVCLIGFILFMGIN